MRYRKLSASGDYTFGHGSGNFYANSPSTVGQLVKTNLLLWQGEWFLDQTTGVPYAGSVLGKNTQSLYDIVIQAAVLGTEGVTQIMSYASSINLKTRRLTVNMTLNTAYGVVTSPIIVTL
jgi:hypothetical protein